jgi:hypothetical protein
MIGEHDEFQPGARGGGGHIVGRAQSVGAVGVHVQHAGNRSVVPRGIKPEGLLREGHDRKNNDGGHEGRHR